MMMSDHGYVEWCKNTYEFHTYLFKRPAYLVCVDSGQEAVVSCLFDRIVVPQACLPESKVCAKVIHVEGLVHIIQLPNTTT
jgi:hypothetical protein